MGTTNIRPLSNKMQKGTWTNGDKWGRETPPPHIPKSMRHKIKQCKHWLSYTRQLRL